jgi:hypothetical protein
MSSATTAFLRIALYDELFLNKVFSVQETGFGLFLPRPITHTFEELLYA